MRLIQLAVILIVAIPFVVLLDFRSEESTEQVTIIETTVQETATTGDELTQGDIDPISGLIVDEHYELVRATCGACHSTALVAQNRATREGWKDLIVWMQETQKLWNLGESEDSILDYLAKNYAPKEQGRRTNLTNIEWYELD